MAATQAINARLNITPSIRQQDVVRSAEEYMTGQVEPILDELVVYLCLQRPRPKELPKYIVEWLVQKKDGKSLMPEPDPKSPFKRTDIDASMRLLYEEILKQNPLPEKPIDFLVKLARKKIYSGDDDL